MSISRSTSIVMSTRDKPSCLVRTLDSIWRQRNEIVDLNLETIVVDDGSSTTETEKLCRLKYPSFVKYVRLENPIYRNPSVARNVGYRMAKGDVVIAQSDDVVHFSADVIWRLTMGLQQGEFLIATVDNYDFATEKILAEYTGRNNPRPFFFLGSLWRKDLYAVGGNDEEFTSPGFDDDWFGDCLTKGLGLKPRFLDDVIGLHQNHHRPKRLAQLVEPSRLLYERKKKAAEAGEIKWEASGGPWAFVPGVSAETAAAVDVVNAERDGE